MPDIDCIHASVGHVILTLPDMASAPRSVAIVGGGLAGTMCALIARSRGLRPVIFDAGRRGLGGRLAGGHAPDSGAQFLRASEPSQFSQVLEMLQREGLVAPWTARFGLLGSHGGGFLPLDTLKGSGMLAKPESLEGGGDFCGFLRSSHATTSATFRSSSRATGWHARRTASQFSPKGC